MEDMHFPLLLPSGTPPLPLLPLSNEVHFPIEERRVTFCSTVCPPSFHTAPAKLCRWVNRAGKLNLPPLWCPFPTALALILTLLHVPDVVDVHFPVHFIHRERK